MKDLIDLSTGNAALIGLLGYLVVFFGVFLLMLVVLLLGRIMKRRTEKTKPAPPPEEPVPETRPEAPGRGEVELYGTNPRDAAVIMAIVANRLGKPLEERRFKSIKEVK